MPKPKISIEYCTAWDYTPKAVSVTAELVKSFEPQISSWELIPSGGGAFEVKVGDELVYSKLKTGRHTTADELRPLIEAQL